MKHKLILRILARRIPICTLLVFLGFLCCQQGTAQAGELIYNSDKDFDVLVREQNAAWCQRDMVLRISMHKKVTVVAIKNPKYMKVIATALMNDCQKVRRVLIYLTSVKDDFLFAFAAEKDESWKPRIGRDIDDLAYGYIDELNEENAGNAEADGPSFIEKIWRFGDAPRCPDGYFFDNDKFDCRDANGLPVPKG